MYVLMPVQSMQQQQQQQMLLQSMHAVTSHSLPQHLQQQQLLMLQAPLSTPQPQMQYVHLQQQQQQSAAFMSSLPVSGSSLPLSMPSHLAGLPAGGMAPGLAEQGGGSNELLVHMQGLSLGSGGYGQQQAAATGVLVPHPMAMQKQQQQQPLHIHAGMGAAGGDAVAGMLVHVRHVRVPSLGGAPSSSAGGSSQLSTDTALLPAGLATGAHLQSGAAAAAEQQQQQQLWTASAIVQPPPSQGVFQLVGGAVPNPPPASAGAAAAPPRSGDVLPGLPNAQLRPSFFG
jgi:hypothetical protein